MYKSVLKHSLVLGIGAAIGRVFPYAFIFWVANRLTHVEYNTVSAIFMWSTFISTVIGLGLSTVMTQRVSQEKSKEQAHKIATAYYQILVFGLLLAAIASYLLGNAVFELLFSTAVIRGVYIPAVLAGLGWPQLMFFIAVANANRMGVAASTMAASGGIFQGFGMLVGYLIDPQAVQGTLWGLAISSVIAAVLGYVILIRSGIDLLGNWSKEGLKCLRYAFPDFRPIAINTFSSWAVMPVGFLAGSYISRASNGQVELAQYYFLEQISQFIVYFPALLGQVLMPYISRQYHTSEEDKSKFILLALRVVGALLFVAVITSVITATFDRDLIRMLGSSHLNEDSLRAARLMLFNALLTLPLTVLGATINGTGSLKFGGIVNIIWGSCVIATCMTIPEGGNFSFQLARVVASISIIVLSALFLMAKSNKICRELGK